MILKFLLPVALSVTIISSLSFFSSAGIAQEDPFCFMINSSGQVVSLNNLCDDQRRSAKKGSWGEGPFDKDGFPIALSPELNRLTAVVKAKQKRGFNSKDSEEQSTTEYEDPEVQSA